MHKLLITASASAFAALLVACGPSDGRDYREGVDTPRAAPAATPTLSAPPDSTTGVARSTGGPAAAGTRAPDVSAPRGKSPDPKSP